MQFHSRELAGNRRERHSIVEAESPVLSYDTPMLMTSIRRTRALAARSPCWLCAPSPPRSQPGRAPTDIDAWVARAMTTFEVPGISLAVVKDGKVVVAKGYGVRKLGDRAPVDAQTLFGIASNTKAFTATALGLLVEEGKLRWDDRVIDHLPWFQLSDPVRHARADRARPAGSSQRAGPWRRRPAVVALLHLQPREIARRLRYLPLATSFRSAYAYDNVLYLRRRRSDRGGQRAVLGGLRAQRASSRRSA